MFDIITFGSASQDIYLKSGKFIPILNKKFTTGKAVCLDFGSKNEVDEVFLSTGGGGTNAAATFALQGLKTAYCGKLGADLASESIISELKKFGICTDFILKDKNFSTNISVILTGFGNERTILVYRGASDNLGKKDIPWQKIKNAKWFYFAPFSGKLAENTQELIDFAKKNGIFIAFNPGYAQLNFKTDLLKRILQKIDILILNQEEAAHLTKIPYKKETEIFKKIDKLTKGIVIMTKGAEGATVSDGKYIYFAKPLDVKVAEKTGAGDAFGSGFVSGIIEKNDLVYAIQLAVANSAANITEIGAKTGLLRRGQKWEKVKVKINKI
ncbi:MAG: carbohydrate kinase family protein [Candidatus Pacebacteria bacterium]|nr:carbohydrate kinase family protein [Candidatus Paceibacterota bacterium]